MSLFLSGATTDGQCEGERKGGKWIRRPRQYPECREAFEQRVMKRRPVCAGRGTALGPSRDVRTQPKALHNRPHCWRLPFHCALKLNALQTGPRCYLKLSSTAAWRSLVLIMGVFWTAWVFKVIFSLSLDRPQWFAAKYRLKGEFSIL